MQKFVKYREMLRKFYESKERCVYECVSQRLSLCVPDVDYVCYMHIPMYIYITYINVITVLRVVKEIKMF